MAFNTINFLFFFVVVFHTFWATKTKYRWLVLLVGSYVFYGALLRPALIVALAVVTLMTFWLGKRIYLAQSKKSRYRILWFGVLGNLAILIYFKYLPFLAENLNSLLGVSGLGIRLPAPALQVSIALSFFVFQAIAYLADIYFRMAQPEESLGHFALYLSFFPKLMQGPIERAGGLLPQLKEPSEFDYDRLRSAMLLFGWGLFKKIVIADRLAQYVNAVYGDVHSYSGLTLVLATYTYALQIYFDFSGYTDMARGVARAFGIDLTENFKNPYHATSMADFWRRWHISLSKWILDYIFEPLQMQFRNWGKPGSAAALVVTFVAAGIWHGPSWGYVVFGLLHGIYLASSIYYKPFEKKSLKKLGVAKSQWVKAWQIFVTFNLVCSAYIFFRGESIKDSLYIVQNLVRNWGTVAYFHKFFGGGSVEEFAVTVLLAVSIIVYEPRIMAFNEGGIQPKPVRVRWAYYYCMILAIIVFGVTAPSQFIYFKF